MPSPFQELVLWLANRVNPDVEETVFGWRLQATALRVDWDLVDDNFTLIISGRPKMENLTLLEVKDEIEGWFF